MCAQRTATLKHVYRFTHGLGAERGWVGRSVGSSRPGAVTPATQLHLPITARVLRLPSSSSPTLSGAVASPSWLSLSLGSPQRAVLGRPAPDFAVCHPAASPDLRVVAHSTQSPDSSRRCVKPSRSLDFPEPARDHALTGYGRLTRHDTSLFLFRRARLLITLTPPPLPAQHGCVHRFCPDATWPTAAGAGASRRGITAGDDSPPHLLSYRHWAPHDALSCPWAPLTPLSYLWAPLTSFHTTGRR